GCEQKFTLLDFYDVNVEMYPMLERISPRTRKLELFARMHNTHAGWISLGNQLNGVRLVDEGLRARHIINARQVLRPSVQVVAGWYPLFLTYLGRVKKATRGVQTRCS
ncbi:hypothetical protein GOP47_0020691, partial [Adiantum capillus-veneris]